MSKNLEKEYRAFANSEVPDLWFRIEAGLDGKATSDISVSESDTDTEMMDLRMTDLHKKWHPKKSFFKVWTGLAAACVCAALILPAMMRTMRMGDRIGSSDNAVPEYSPQLMDSYDSAAGAYEEGVYIDSAAGDAEAACEDSAAQAAEVTVDDSRNDNSSTTAENIYISSDANKSLNSDSDLSAATDGDVHADSDAGTDNMASAGLNTGVENAAFPAEAAEEEKDAYQFAATVEILDTDIRMNSGILYTAKVVTSDNPAVQADSEIKIFSPAVLPEGVTALEKAQTYALILREKDSDDSEQDAAYILVDK